MSIRGKNPKATDSFLDIRAIFTKTDRARYISHLDLYRAMQRAFKRAKIPVWYTQGYNQRLYITFGLALSLGFESSCEVMEFRIVEDTPLHELEERLKGVMPDGLRIVKLYYPVMKMKDIGFSDFSIRFNTDSISVYKVQELFNELLAQDKILVYKKNKKKQLIETDLKPYVQLLDSTIEKDVFRVTLRLPAGNGLNVNPTLICNKFIESLPCDVHIESVHYTREKILSTTGEDFI